MNNELAELLGIHIGDGCISVTQRYSEYYLGGDITEEKEYHNTWVKPLFDKNIMFPLYNKFVNYKEHPKVGIYGFHIFDEKIVSYFKTLGIKSGSKINVQVPEIILNNKKYYTRFLRGLFDTDGTIYFEKNYSSKNPMHNQPRIKLAITSQNLMSEVKQMLETLGFTPRFKKPYKGKKDKNYTYPLLLSRRRDIKNFIEKIEFKNSKHVTKWQVFKKFGYCPPKTTLAQRKAFLKSKTL